MNGKQERPAWLDEGLVFSSVQELLAFRIRRGDGLSVDAEEQYERQRFEEAVKALAEAGVTLAVANAHKCFGFAAEEEDIESAVQYAKRCHQHGIRVGTYVGETLAYETLFTEKPEAEDWVATRYDGKRVYWHSQTFRFVPCKNHPGWIDFQKQVVKLAVERIGVDFIHFDNVYVWREPDSCHCKVCTQMFRDFLGRKYTHEQRKRRLGFSDLSGIRPPAYATEGGGRHPKEIQRITDPLQQDWIDFRCEGVAQMYRQLCDYARSLKPDIVLECNPVITCTNGAFQRGVDIPRLVGNGHAFWVEDGNAARLEPDGRLVGNIRTFKMARTLNNAAFSYVTDADPNVTRLRVAEAMAFNLDCVGPVGRSEAAQDFITFFRKHRELYARNQTLADVAVLRSFRSLAWENVETHLSTLLVEQVLIQHQIPFHIVFDADLDRLADYRAVVLAEVQFMSDAEIEKVRAYVKDGGTVLAVGATSRYDEMARRRHALGLADVLGTDGALAAQEDYGKGRAAYLPEVVPKPPLPVRGDYYMVDNRYWHLPANTDEVLSALRWCLNGRPLVEVDAGLNVAVEICERQAPHLLILHAVNYDLNRVLSDVPVSLKVPDGAKVNSVRVLSPGADLEVACVTDGGRLSFSFPELKIYAVARIALG
jgi:hypothetical protein